MKPARIIRRQCKRTKKTTKTVPIGVVHKNVSGGGERTGGRWFGGGGVIPSGEERKVKPAPDICRNHHVAVLRFKRMFGFPILFSSR